MGISAPRKTGTKKTVQPDAPPPGVPVINGFPNIERIFPEDFPGLFFPSDDASSYDNIFLLVNHYIMMDYLLDKKLKELDLAQVVGYPFESRIRNQLVDLEIELVWNSNEKKPFYKKGYKSSSLVIPAPNRFKIDWHSIKRLMGGRNGFLFGNYKCWIECVSPAGGIHKIVGFGHSEDAAEDLVMGMLNFSECEMIGIPRFSKASYRMQNREWTSDDNRKNTENVRMYPYKMNICNRAKIKKEARELAIATLGQKTKNKYVDLDKYSFDMYLDIPHAHYERDIKLALLKRLIGTGQ